MVEVELTGARHFRCWFRPTNRHVQISGQDLASRESGGGGGVGFFSKKPPQYAELERLSIISKANSKRDQTSSVINEC
jgi:hypothetical protein